ncbi:MAG: P-loop NTPase [Candidatus Hadarchaeales archaeon]
MGGENRGIGVNRLDPRPPSIDDSLRDVRRIIAVVSGKGGVGKSVISATAALHLAKSGKRVGLLDLDFQSPCLHLILGARDEKPAEDRGLIPPAVSGVRLMSVVHFSGDMPLPLEGREVSDAFTEMLTVTRWGGLDLLIVDAPPGIGDEFLDLVRLINRTEFLVITTPSPLAVKSAQKVVRVLRDSGSTLLGIISNMDDAGKPGDLGAPCLGSIPFDAELEECIGRPERILRTRFSRALNEILKRIV